VGVAPEQLMRRDTTRGTIPHELAPARRAGIAIGVSNVLGGAKRECAYDRFPALEEQVARRFKMWFFPTVNNSHTHKQVVVNRIRHNHAPEPVERLFSSCTEKCRVGVSR
tara:strand:- start:20555 stop:20884 length:330 start_codon:yes stop_codon:yes gene_type:complete